MRCAHALHLALWHEAQNDVMGPLYNELVHDVFIEVNTGTAIDHARLFSLLAQ